MVRSTTSRTSQLVLGSSGTRVLLVGGGGVVPEALRGAFVHRCGLAEENLRVLLDPASPLELGDAVAAAAEAASGTLVVYVAGTVFVDGEG
ncbi:hypothetical protein, partial [Frankia sp. AgKG'84/4]